MLCYHLAFVTTKLTLVGVVFADFTGVNVVVVVAAASIKFIVSIVVVIVDIGAGASNVK